MDYQELLRKRDAYQEGKHLIPELTIASYERAFEIEYTHHSTAIEGNTLTLMETKLVLEDRISVGGKRLRELYEPLNHEKAFHYVKDCIGNAVNHSQRRNNSSSFASSILGRCAPDASAAASAARYSLNAPIATSSRPKPGKYPARADPRFRESAHFRHPAMPLKCRIRKRPKNSC